MTLEDLLNTLIKRGWKPFGWKDIKRVNNEGWFVSFVHKSKKRPWLSEVSHRELVSKESGLWQFVCENGMINKEGNVFENYGKDNCEYWLCKCALKDESELEEFLLSNIVIKDEKNIIKN